MNHRDEERLLTLSVETADGNHRRTRRGIIKRIVGLVLCVTAFAAVSTIVVTNRHTTMTTMTGNEDDRSKGRSLFSLRSFLQFGEEDNEALTPGFRFQRAGQRSTGGGGSNGPPTGGGGGGDEPTKEKTSDRDGHDRAIVGDGVSASSESSRKVHLVAKIEHPQILVAKAGASGGRTASGLPLHQIEGVFDVKLTLTNHGDSEVYLNVHQTPFSDQEMTADIVSNSEVRRT